MNKSHRGAALTAAVLVFSAQATFAQVTEDGMGKIVPVEMFVCNFVEGKGQADLDVVVKQWSDFMDDKKIRNYAAWQLTPYYYGGEQDFDMIWMGASSDGNAMGNATHEYVMNGGEIAAGFEEVIQCRAHVGLSSAMYQAPPDNSTPSSSVMTMSDCKMEKGTRYSDVRAAEVEWAAYRKDNGSKAGMWHWYPSFGGGDQDLDYKIVYAYPSFKELGSDWELIANGGGRVKSDDIFGDLDECDDARVYVARSIREAQLRK
ncbi:MAG: hypothetical protein NWP69_00855 [Congregibacter sp.]|nr:hypothetical protein [Congregibacter sp.]MDP5069549.1 hypothetical protein [Congregibacter sp.]